MTTDPAQLTLVGADELARHHEGAILLLLHRLATWAATPDDQSIDWELERVMQDLAKHGSALRQLRGDATIPF